MQGAVLPLWLSAAATVLTLVFAVVLVVLGYRGQRAVVRRLTVVEELYRRDADQRSRVQAELVCAWPVSEQDTFKSVIQRAIVGAAVRNASDTPVYDVELVYVDRPAAWTATNRIKMVPPGNEPEVYAGFEEEGTTSDTPAPDRINVDGSIRLARSVEMALILRFTDRRGIRWVRTEDGALEQVVVLAAPAPAPAPAPADASADASADA